MLLPPKFLGLLALAALAASAAAKKNNILFILTDGRRSAALSPAWRRPRGRGCLMKMGLS